MAARPLVVVMYRIKGPSFLTSMAKKEGPYTAKHCPGGKKKRKPDDLRSKGRENRRQEEGGILFPDSPGKLYFSEWGFFPFISEFEKIIFALQLLYRPVSAKS